MFMDKDLVFSDGYALSGGDGSSDVVDLGKLGDAYKEPWLVVQVTNDADAAGGTSLAVKLQTCAAEDFASGVKDLAVSPTVLTASLTKNSEIMKMRLPLGKLRYLRMNYDVTGTFTAGKVRAFVTPDVMTDIPLY